MAVSHSHVRWIAPLALLAVLAACAAIVTSSPAPGGGTGSDRAEHTSTPHIPYRYKVRAGDTLSAIATRFTVPVEQLQRLNPGIDSFTLQPGRRVKLRPMRR